MERTLPGMPQQASPKEPTRPDRSATARHSNRTNTMAEVKRSLRSLKNGKTSRCDNIPRKAWKKGGMVSAKVLHSLLNKIWNEEDIPQDRKLGPLVKLSKKGDLCNFVRFSNNGTNFFELEKCSNFRIMLFL